MKNVILDYKWLQSLCLVFSLSQYQCVKFVRRKEVIEIQEGISAPL